MDLKDRLRALREETGLTQKDFAKKMNIANTTYNNYETGTREPDKETLKRFATFFDCTIDYLLGYSDIRNPYISARENKRDDSSNESGENEWFSLKQLKEFLKEQRESRKSQNRNE